MMQSNTTSIRQKWQRFVARLRELLTRTTPSAAESTTTMFAAIQRRLLLWYAGILAAMLLLAGIFLYGAMQQLLLGQIDSNLAQNTQQVLKQNGSACDIPDFERQVASLVACFDTNAQVGADSRPAQDTPAFLDTALVQRALTQGSASDTVDGGAGIGAIRRYAVAVHDPIDGHTVGVVMVGVGISDRITALHTLLMLLLIVGALTLVGATLGGLFLARRALEPARLAFARQQQFIGDASHELRTPLTLMRADAEVLLRHREGLPPDDTDLLEDIVVETEHLSAIASSLLTLARLDAGAQHIERDVVNLSEVGANALRRVQAFAGERGILLEQSFDPQVVVLGDARLLEQLVILLLDNAIKYNRPGGRVMLRTVLAGGEARLEVHDTGEGIPPEHLARLGERFYRVDKARSREAGGAGLGISIARGIASANGGSLELASTPSRGTMAAVRLPAVSPVAR